MGKRGPKPKKLIDTIWTQELAYIIGLITTDGCLSKDGRHIDFTSQDLQLIKLFKKCLGLRQIKIGLKSSGSTNRKCPHIQFGDVNFYKWLMSLGLTPAKSKTLNKLKIPDKYFFDFLRGCFDGDGSMYAYWDPRWRSSYMFYLQLASASPPFLSWLQKTVFRLSGVKGRIGPSARSWQLRFAKKETLILFNKMFYKSDLPYLKRKLVKALKIFKIDEDHRNHAQVEELADSHL